jgi:hypothetical protein
LLQNAAPVQPDVKENKGAGNHTAANAATARGRRGSGTVNDYDRREPREFQVTRFG